MILECSRGHVWDTDDQMMQLNHAPMKAGGHCPMLMSYDRMSGSSYCRRVLKVSELTHPLMFIDDAQEADEDEIKKKREGKNG